MAVKDTSPKRKAPAKKTSAKKAKKTKIASSMEFDKHPASGEKLSYGKQILWVLATAKQLGMPGLENGKVMEYLGGLSPETKSVRGDIASIKKQNFMEQTTAKTSTIWTITDAGSEHVATYVANLEEELSSAEVLEKLVAFCFSSPKESMLVRHLWDGEVHTETELLEYCEISSPQTKSYRDTLTKLKNFGYLEQLKGEDGEKAFQLVDKYRSE